MGGGSKVTQTNWTLEGKNRTLGGRRGVKNHPKISDIIYGRSLSKNVPHNVRITFLIFFFHFKNWKIGEITSFGFEP